MKRLLLVLLVILIVSPVTTPQTRRRATASKSKSSSAAAAKVMEVRTAGASKVADQIKFLAKFIYLLGGANSSLAAVDESVRRKEAGPDVAQRNQLAKSQVRSSITGFREALDKLEIEFRATPELQPYYIKLAGVAAGAANAEQLAANNRFDEAGRSLLEVVNRLTDVLVAMRS